MWCAPIFHLWLLFSPSCSEPSTSIHTDNDPSLAEPEMVLLLSCRIHAVAEAALASRTVPHAWQVHRMSGSRIQ